VTGPNADDRLREEIRHLRMQRRRYRELIQNLSNIVDVLRKQTAHTEKSSSEIRIFEYLGPETVQPTDPIRNVPIESEHSYRNGGFEHQKAPDDLRPLLPNPGWKCFAVDQPQIRIGFTLFGMTAEAIDEAVEVVEQRQVRSRDFTPVFLTDGTDLAPFRSRGYVVEYIPTSVTSRTSKNRALLQYLRARLELIKDKWGLGDLVHLGDKNYGENSFSTATRKSIGSRDPVEPAAEKSGVVFSAKSNLESLSVDVIICVHNALDDVRQCLGTVRSTIENHHTLIVVDDGSDEDTARFLRCLSDDDGRVNLIRRNTAAGYTKAANCGIENSTADFIILLNSDTQVPTDWWKKLAGAVFQSPNTGIVGPMSNAATWQSVPEINVGGARRAVNAMPHGFTVDDMDRIAEACSPALFPRVGLANGFCFGVRRTVFDAIGLFDEESFPRGYGEENDFCIRAVDAGFEIVIATNCYVYHEESSSYSPSVRDKLALETERVLLAKYSAPRIREAVNSCKNNPTLTKIRKCFGNRLATTPI